MRIIRQLPPKEEKWGQQYDNDETRLFDDLWRLGVPTTLIRDALGQRNIQSLICRAEPRRKVVIGRWLLDQIGGHSVGLGLDMYPPEGCT